MATNTDPYKDFIHKNFFNEKRESARQDYVAGKPLTIADFIARIHALENAVADLREALGETINWCEDFIQIDELIEPQKKILEKYNITWDEFYKREIK